MPHHGSSYNYRLDSTKHTEISKHYKLSKIQDEKVETILLFYDAFWARCYLISGGGKYGHPHPKVIQGIILANALRCHECIILLTNSCGLDSEKLGQLHQIVPKWTQYVKIYHYDDVFFIKQRHIMLHPGRCISDVHENTVKWTPKGYINRIKIMLPAKPMINEHSRPLKKNMLIEKSTVEITIQGTSSFNAHIICVPLPHNPRSGDKINYCYIIEESIASFQKHYFCLTTMIGYHHYQEPRSTFYFSILIMSGRRSNCLLH